MSLANLRSYNPVTGGLAWSGPSADTAAIDQAVARARAAQLEWCRVSLADRATLLERFAEQVTLKRDEIVRAISLETGKPFWEAEGEAKAMAGKPKLAIEAFHQRTPDQVVEAGTGGEAGGTAQVIRYQAHGVMVVLGPFNLPGHLPGSHMVPALMAGNAVIFKPSEKTPGVGALLGTLWAQTLASAQADGLVAPEHLVQVVQGGASIGSALTKHPGIDGVLFTGGLNAGRAILEATAATPGRMVALELGGNSPVIVHEPGANHDPESIAATARLAVMSAFVGAGQRCNATRRFIVTNHPGASAFIEAFVAAAATVRVGAPTDEPEPFCGPVISAEAGQRVLDTQAAWVERGAKVLLSARGLQGSTRLITPGIVDTTGVDLAELADEEAFGPLCRIIRVQDAEEAVREANATRFGLAAAVWTRHRSVYDTLRPQLRAGVVNWNLPTTGASSRMPFGGVGDSGNHRPSGYFAADYAAYPVASMEAEHLTGPALPGASKTGQAS